MKSIIALSFLLLSINTYSSLKNCYSFTTQEAIMSLKEQGFQEIGSKEFNYRDQRNPNILRQSTAYKFEHLSLENLITYAWASCRGTGKIIQMGDFLYQGSWQRFNEDTSQWENVRKGEVLVTIKDMTVDHFGASDILIVKKIKAKGWPFFDKRDFVFQDNGDYFWSNYPETVHLTKAVLKIYYLNKRFVGERSL